MFKSAGDNIDPGKKWWGNLQHSRT